jgi:hypothetical protein
VAEVDVSGVDFIQQQALAIKARHEWLIREQDELGKLRAAYLALTGEELHAVSMDADLDELREELEAAKSKVVAFRNKAEEAESRRLAVVKQRDEALGNLDTALRRTAELERERDEAQQLLEQATAPEAKQPEAEPQRPADGATEKSLTERVLEYFQTPGNGGESTIQDVATAVGAHPESIRKPIRKLAADGLVVQNEAGVGRTNTWSLAPTPESKSAKPPAAKPQYEEQPPFAVDVAMAVTRIARPREWWSVSELRDKLPGISEHKLKDRIEQLIRLGFLEWNEGHARGSKYRWTGKTIGEAFPDAPAAPAPAVEERAPEPAPVDREALSPAQQMVVWIEANREYGDAFSPQQVAEGAKLPKDQVLSVLERFVQRGVLADDSPSDDMRIFSRIKPEHVRKAEERAAGRPEVKGQAQRGRPAEGTGRSITIKDAQVRALVQDAIRAGAGVEMASNGHIDVKWEGKRVQIAHTPSSSRTVLNDRTRLRRQGLEV